PPVPDEGRGHGRVHGERRPAVGGGAAAAGVFAKPGQDLALDVGAGVELEPAQVAVGPHLAGADLLGQGVEEPILDDVGAQQEVRLAGDVVPELRGAGEGLPVHGGADVLAVDLV